MTVTRTKLEKPATFGGYRLAVDDVDRPTQVTAYRLAEPGETSAPVATRSYTPADPADDLIDWLVDEAGAPKGTARALVVQVVSKVHAAALRA